METLIAQQVLEAPEHPILPNAKKYDVRELRVYWEIGKERAVVEIEASTHETYVMLRFDGVGDIHIPSSDLITNVSLKIQDTSQCPTGAPYIPAVRVGGINECNGLSFWADSVTRINNNEIKNP